MIKKALSKWELRANFKNQYQLFLDLQKQTNKRFKLNPKSFIPCLDDNIAETGFDRHYAYHPAWAMRIIKRYNPSKHIDISSSLHFCANLSAFIPVDFYYYRLANLHLSNLKSLHGDLMDLSFESNSVESISYMRTIEYTDLEKIGIQWITTNILKRLMNLKE